MTPVQTLLERICSESSFCTSFNIENGRRLNPEAPAQFHVWVTELDGVASAGSCSTAAAAARICEDFMSTSRDGIDKARLVLPFSIGRSSYILVLDQSEFSSSDDSTTVSLADIHSEKRSWRYGAWPWSSDYSPLDPSSPKHLHSGSAQNRRFLRWTPRWQTALLAALALSLAFGLFFFTLDDPEGAPDNNATNSAKDKKWPDDGWIRYRTPNSSGPRRQLRIYHHNATAWSQANPHNSGEWRVRIDDQALIPAELYDADEDRYQQWFINRYPHLQRVVETKQYIRPAWLGSLDILVPWDHEFHMAHCVLAFRRYWKARESGTHVCPRDIDHNHIKHCLDWFDEYAFPPGPMTVYEGPGADEWKLWWQTKVCF
ncbi:hypothetical protein B0T14DRAFT_522352 [Immersiella caudata]|uniref:Uncharacterized protein n=1 Tax=Immersiella caudata TaxID=314043 RepID=A0AA39WT99_9PEZI|nr:hypothetical protein B0T14DRAFT_522352 [Immersiella caudata]